VFSLYYGSGEEKGKNMLKSDVVEPGKSVSQSVRYSLSSYIISEEAMLLPFSTSLFSLYF
jgi:hypothetical protein